jgi:hypothetical protein
VPGERYRCQPACRARGEALFGTASLVRRWLLIEQEGPWGPTALTQSRIDSSTARSIAEAARAAGARPILIRKPGRPKKVGCRVYAAFTGEKQAWIESFTLPAVAALLELELSPLKRGLSVGGERLEEPLFLVCTHGKHDACCAQFGRPVAQALFTLDPASLWECSHIGGDRFAANLVCFPHGLYFGHVTPETAPRVASLYRAGRIDLEHYRGRSTYPFAVQAAEWFLRRETGIDPIDGLELVRHAEDGELHEALFAVRDGPDRRVVVRVSRETLPVLLTCQSTDPSSPPRYELVAIDPRVGD